MFWGLVLKANRKYTQKTSKSFHISQAVLDVNSSGVGSNQLFITYEDQKYLICDLNKDKTVQVPLDLNFAAGDEICFQSQGNGCIYLTGYLTDLPDNSMLSDDDDDENDEEIESDMENEDLKASDKSANNDNSKSKKAKGGAKTNVKAVAAAVMANEDDDSDEDDSDFNADLGGGLDVEEDDSDDENDAEEDDEGDDSDDEVESPKPKLIKLDKQAKQNGVADKKDASKKEKKNKKEKKQENAQKQQTNSVEKTIQGGVKIQDIVVGSGAEVKPGKKAQVFYEGRLKQNNKVFDSVKQGAGFKFNVGRGDVIKGWDIGVVGMKVGGKRRITCPPHMAYGARGMPPQIPPNSTLVFEVELKGA